MSDAEEADPPPEDGPPSSEQAEQDNPELGPPEPPSESVSPDDDRQSGPPTNERAPLTDDGGSEVPSKLFSDADVVSASTQGGAKMEAAAAPAPPTQVDADPDAVNPDTGLTKAQEEKLRIILGGIFPGTTVEQKQKIFPDEVVYEPSPPGTPDPFEDAEACLEVGNLRTNEETVGRSNEETVGRFVFFSMEELPRSMEYPR